MKIKLKDDLVALAEHVPAPTAKERVLMDDLARLYLQMVLNRPPSVRQRKDRLIKGANTELLAYLIHTKVLVRLDAQFALHMTHLTGLKGAVPILGR